MYFVYLLQSVRYKTYYVGFTSRIDLRIIEHNAGKTPSIRYGIPWNLVYFEGYANRSSAIIREKQLKHHGKGISVIKKRLNIK